MTSNIANQVAYLRVSREYPEDLHQLCEEVGKSYEDIANAVNNRTISLYPTNRPAQTGNSYFVTQNRKQQTLRQVYTFTGAGPIPTGMTTLPQVIQGFGSYTDGTNRYGVLYGTNVAIAGQVSFYVTPTTIVVLFGAGAPAMAVGSVGIIVIEWLSAP